MGKKYTEVKQVFKIRRRSKGCIKMGFKSKKQKKNHENIIMSTIQKSDWGFDQIY